MPEAKNTFLKAKMNKDLDDRLLPNGEYRDAQNVLVGKSEEDNVGTLQNIRGNKILDDLEPPTEDSFIIGYLMDSTKNRIYVFFTDDGANHSIRYHNVNAAGNNPTGWITLIEGEFLNFSTNFPIISVNLLEDLLFWTDNNNQPRKINVTHSLGYYTEEHQISVAKYNPYQPISLVKQEIEEITQALGPGVFNVYGNLNIVPGMVVLSKRGSTSVITANDFITVESVSQSPQTTTVTLSSTSPSIQNGDVMYFLSSTMTDESSNAAWPGDPSYLEDKFVRFSYRFKFDDNEYSIFAPFTQIAFIPKQKGYFINGQENEAVSSTILNWFENGINNIDLIIPLPDKGSNISNSYKIKEIDVLYKESDQLAVKVIDTIEVSELTSTSNNYYIYNYQSRKPIRTLPEAQTVRVYDKVPVKAKAQEIIGNRVLYANFLTKLTPPANINYTVNVQEKLGQGDVSNFVEYPNHTIKQNRNYQVGFVLSDKYGRQSDVILSPVSAESDDKGSTIFVPYILDDPIGSEVPDTNYYTDLRYWNGNSLLVNLLSPITTTVPPQTVLYAKTNGNGFDVDPAGTVSVTDTTYIFDLLSGGQTDVPQEGDYMRGYYKDYVEVTQVASVGNTYTITTDGKVNDMYLKDTTIAASVNDTKFAYTVDVNGWYSYKIVVKQTEQEYYNVYLPSAIGATDFPTATSNTTDTSASVSYITLINDNINKVPRDLAEVGPDQKQYRSSVGLFGRVRPTFVSPTTHGNKQYFPVRTADTSTAVGNTEDLVGAPTNAESIFQDDSNPILARITTNKQFGIDAADITGPDRFQLAIYETEPVVSNLDIYWETSHTGLISDLNTEALINFDGPVAIDGWDDLLNENITQNTSVSKFFNPINSQGQDTTNYSIGMSVVDKKGDDASNKFSIHVNPNNSNQYFIRLDQELVFVEESPERDVFTFTFTITDNFASSSWGTAQLSETLTLSNTPPSFDTQPPNTYYYFFEDSTTSFQIRNFLIENNARNGSTASLLNQDELRFYISGTNANLFDIDTNTGVLTPNSNGVAAGFNTYEIDVTLKDANGSADGASVTQSYTIIKGFTPTNVTLGEDNVYIEMGSNNPAVGYDSVQYVFYMAASDVSESDLPTIPNVDIGDTFRIGGTQTLTQGSFQFGVENIYAEDANFDDPSLGLASFDLDLRVYYRANSNSNWIDTTTSSAPPKDLNNRLFKNGSNPISVTAANVSNASAPLYRANIYYAQDTPGEYAFVVHLELSSSFNTYCTANFSGVLRDLHYTNSESGGQRIYTYIVFDNNGSGYNSVPTSVAGSSTTTVYSDQPLAEYNTKFWTTSDLSVVYTPPVGGKYYVVRHAFDKIYNTYNATNNDFLIGIPVLLSSSGEIQRTSSTTHVTTKKMTQSGSISSLPSNTSNTIVRRTSKPANVDGNELYSWPELA